MCLSKCSLHGYTMVDSYGVAKAGLYKLNAADP
jgi:hypothetical protein